MDVRLERDTLTVTTTVTATGDTAVPISFGFHPYLQLPDLPRAEWRIELPVGRHLLLDHHAIPTGESEPADEPAGPLGDRTYDDGYADLTDPPAFVLEGGGRRVEVRFGANYAFAQVFAPPGQDLICYEPMTAPTNALASGWNLQTVPPGESFAADFEVVVRRL
jgi:galactose mutarotase-like enzyme